MLFAFGLIKAIQILSSLIHISKNPYTKGDSIGDMRSFVIVHPTVHSMTKARASNSGVANGA